MPTFKKIPPNIKAIGVIALGHYAIFCKGLIKAAAVATILQREDNKNGIPGVGFITLKKEKIYYCRYGYVNNPIIYSKRIKSK